LVQLSDSGFTLSFVRVFAKQYRMYELEGQKDEKVYKKYYKKYLNLASLVFVILSITAGITTCIVYVFLTADKLGSAFGHENYLIYFVGLYVSISVLNFKNTSILQGINRLYTTKYMEATADLFRFLLGYSIVLLGHRVFGLVLLWTLSRLGQLLVSSYYLRRVLQISIFESWRFRYDKELFNYLWSPTWRQGLIQIGGYLINNANALVITKIGDVKVISAFLLTQRLVNMGRQFAQAPLYANLPSIVGTIGSGDFLGGFKKSIPYLRLSVVLFVIFSVLMLFAEDVFGLLRLNFTILSRVSLVLFLGTMLLEMHHGMHAQIYMGTNKVPFLIPSLISGMLILGLSYRLAENYGVLSVLFVQFLVQLLFNNWYPIRLNLRLSGMTVGQYLLRLINNNGK